MSGSLPFRTLDRAALGDAHLHITPPPITDAPAAIAQVVLRALAKRPQDRWQTALAFGNANGADARGVQRAPQTRVVSTQWPRATVVVMFSTPLIRDVILASGLATISPRHVFARGA